MCTSKHYCNRIWEQVWSHIPSVSLHGCDHVSVMIMHVEGIGWECHTSMADGQCTWVHVAGVASSKMWQLCFPGSHSTVAAAYISSFFAYLAYVWPTSIPPCACEPPRLHYNSVLSFAQCQFLADKTPVFLIWNWEYVYIHAIFVSCPHYCHSTCYIHMQAFRYYNVYILSSTRLPIVNYVSTP